MIPNEKLAGGMLKNDTLARRGRARRVVWLPPEADAELAIAALRGRDGQDVTVAEAVPWGVRLAVGGDPVPPADGPARGALRRQCLAAGPRGCFHGRLSRAN